jgi:hypothetical protein
MVLNFVVYLKVFQNELSVKRNEINCMKGLELETPLIRIVMEVKICIEGIGVKGEVLDKKEKTVLIPGGLSKELYM